MQICSIRAALRLASKRAKTPDRKVFTEGRLAGTGTRRSTTDSRTVSLSAPSRVTGASPRSKGFIFGISSSVLPAGAIPDSR